jgi:esterase/lipase superfamily enzyme
MRVLGLAVACGLLAGCAQQQHAITQAPHDGARTRIARTAHFRPPHRSFQGFGYSTRRHYYHSHWAPYHASLRPDDNSRRAGEVADLTVPSKHEFPDEGQAVDNNPTDIGKAVEKPAQDAGKTIERLNPASDNAVQHSGTTVPAYNVRRSANEISKTIEQIPFINKNIKGVQSVYFATNRKIQGGPNLTSGLTISQISWSRSDKLAFGVVDVSISKDHHLGHVETPGKYFFGLIDERASDAKHFMVQKISSLGRDEFAKALANPADSLMLFVHGYNVSFADAAFKAAQIAFDANYQGRVVMFSWPSKAGFLDYDYDRESAIFSSDGLFELLKLIKEEAKVSRIILVAHSLGSEVTVGALQQAALSGTRLGISELVFAAPDVDSDVFLERAAQIKAVAGNVTVYASSADKALLASKKKAQSISRMGYVLKSGPILVDGVDTIDVTAVGDDMFGLNHSTFSNSRAVLDDVGRIISEDVHQLPNIRTPTLQFMPDKLHPTYWMYPY